MHWTHMYLVQFYFEEVQMLRSDTTQQTKIKILCCFILKKTKALNTRAKLCGMNFSKKKNKKSFLKYRHGTVIVPAEYCFCLVWCELCVFLGSHTCSLNIPQLWTAEAKQKNNHRFDICSNKRTFISGKRLNFYRTWASAGIYQITIVCGVTHFYAPDYLRLDRDRK